jgi:hypothetical protein
VSVAISQPVSAIYREEQNFAWWLYVVLVALTLLGFYLLKLEGKPKTIQAPLPGPNWNIEVPLPLLAGLGIPAVLILGVLHMTTEVTPDACRVWFGWLPTYRRAIPLSSIKAVEIVTYNAWREHGFWGLRVTRDGERVLTARGDRAVRVHLTDGGRVLIGTQRPEELAGVLDRERRLYS